MQKRSALTVAILAGLLFGCEQSKQAPATQNADNGYSFERGFPSGDTASKAYDDTDLNSAITAYKFFYPTVSIIATWKGNVAAGLTTNKQFMIMEGSPKQFVFTPNSDTPYEGANIDLSDGPIVIELPPGPLMCVVNDMNQRYVIDMGFPDLMPVKAASTSSCRPAIRARSPLAISAERRLPITCCCSSAPFLPEVTCRRRSPC